MTLLRFPAQLSIADPVAVLLETLPEREPITLPGGCLVHRESRRERNKSTWLGSVPGYQVHSFTRVFLLFDNSKQLLQELVLVANDPSIDEIFRLSYSTMINGRYHLLYTPELRAAAPMLQAFDRFVIRVEAAHLFTLPRLILCDSVLDGDDFALWRHLENIAVECADHYSDAYFAIRRQQEIDPAFNLQSIKLTGGTLEREADQIDCIAHIRVSHCILDTCSTSNAVEFLNGLIPGTGPTKVSLHVMMPESMNDRV